MLKIYDYLLLLKLDKVEKNKTIINKEKGREESLYEHGSCNCWFLKRYHVKIRIDKKTNEEITPLLNLDNLLKI